MPEEIKHPFSNEIFETLRILSFLRKSILQYFILFQRNEQRNVSNNFGRVLFCSHNKVFNGAA